MAYVFLNGYSPLSGGNELAGLISRNIREIKIPAGVTVIGDSAFEGCLSLSSVSFCGDEKRLGRYSFASSAIPSLTLPDGVSEIGDGAFYGCRSLNECSFGSDLSMIGDRVFEGSHCDIYDFSACRAIPELKSDLSFSGIRESALIFVPEELFAEWRSSGIWSSLSDKIVPVAKKVELPNHDGVSEGLDIRRNTLYGKGSCTDSVIVLPEQCRQMENGFLQNDQTVDMLVLSPNGTWLGADMGADSSLRILKNYYGSGVSFALYGTSSLKLVTILDGTNIDYYDFFINEACDVVYDFSAATSVPILGDTWYINTDGNSRILVPMHLYKEWVESTNLLYLKDYIFPVK